MTNEAIIAKSAKDIVESQHKISVSKKEIIALDLKID